ncbi:MAG: hypothetical protein Q7J54_01900 [Candidatus Woesearchaeota archaeon]|nr:hypothetical protein [Candidatus Woesearchaeota archaeon]
MEINSKEFINIMNKNFGYKIIDTKLGKGIIVDSFTAFIYSAVTGAGYLDDPLYLFTPKGLMKLFYNALDYKFVTGIFDNTTLKNTPHIIAQSKKYLFDGEKIIIPVEFESEIELQTKLRIFISEISGPSTKYIIQRIEKSKKGNGMEPFMEYLACEVMKNQDYIVENQIPLSHSAGSPDFGGYKLNEAITFNKIHLIELSLIRLGWNIEKQSKNEKVFCVVGEAKTSTSQIKNQIEKYLKTKFFNKCYEIHPSKQLPSNPKYGLITIDDDYKIKIIERMSNDVLFQVDKQKEYASWLSNYLKYYLIANLTNDEFIKFFQEKRNKKISGVKDIINFVNNLSYEEIFNKIGEICNGSFKR